MIYLNPLVALPPPISINNNCNLLLNKVAATALALQDDTNFSIIMENIVP
ncbi:MAG TPA: hypothetical protein VKA95_12890 [Nitrososphaeraceae archaeon]|nr:hypothetical protein [Nitrososphaeraceae archaeon]